MDREKIFIDSLIKRSTSADLSDDGILLNHKIYAMDLFCEGVHFKRQNFSLKQIARKAFLVNISDILAMGAMPKCALLGISFSQDMNASELKILSSEICAICDEWGIKIIGGDTIKDDKLNIAITLIGDLVKKPIFRRDFKKGEILCCSFERKPQFVLKDMRYLYRGGKIAQYSRFKNPILRAKFINEISGFICGGMDISDGLFCELNRISKLNNIAFKFFHFIPNLFSQSGEEYEFLFAIKSRDKNKLNKIALKNRIKILYLAQIYRGRARFKTLLHHK